MRSTALQPNRRRCRSRRLKAETVTGYLNLAARRRRLAGETLATPRGPRDEAAENCLVSP